MSKSTPLEQLPQGANTGNVQMNMNSDQMSGLSMPPQPQLGNQIQEMSTQMAQDMGMDNEYQRMDVQDNFMKRQFVPQSGMSQPPPSDGYYESPQSNNRQGGYQTQNQNQKQMNIQQVRKNDSESNIKSPITSIFELFRANSKMLAILFALFMAIQMDIVQSIIRTVVRMTKVPDNMIFTVSKVFTSVVGVVLFFIVYRNL